MSGFGWSFILIGVLLSIGTVNPLPLVVAAVVGLLFDGTTKGEQEKIVAAGQSVYTPTGMGWSGCLLWIVGVGLFVVMLGMVGIVAKEGW